MSEAACVAVLGWRDALAPIDTTHDILLSAMDLAVDYPLRIWGAIVPSAAGEIG